MAEHIRRATAADLPAVREIIDAAYEMYLSRMDRPPAPMLREYAPAIEAGALWLTGNPPDALISLTPAGGSCSLRTSLSTRVRKGPVSRVCTPTWS